MRKLIGCCVLAVAVTLSLGSAAYAATTSVQGTGSYTKLVIANDTTNLTFKVFAPGGECAIKYVQVSFRDRDGTRYAMNGGCYPGDAWAASLTRGDTLVACDGFTLRYNATKSAWIGTIPRVCLKRLATAVKVTGSYVDDYSPNINEVAATKYVAQG
jgi:hypothetical protein